MGSVDVLLREWNRDHRIIVEGLGRISKVCEAPVLLRVHHLLACVPVLRLLSACVCKTPCYKGPADALYLLYRYNRPNSLQLPHADAQAFEQQKLPRTEVVSKPLASNPSASISAPPTPPNRETYREQEEVPHIGSPLSAEGAKWLKQHDPSIAAACISVKGDSSAFRFPMCSAALHDATSIREVRESQGGCG